MCNYVGNENKITLILLQSEKIRNLCFPAFKILEKVEENTEHENFVFLLLLLLLSLLWFARHWGRSVSYSWNETSGLAGLLNLEDRFFSNTNKFFSFKKIGRDNTEIEEHKSFLFIHPSFLSWQAFCSRPQYQQLRNYQCYNKFYSLFESLSHSFLGSKEKPKDVLILLCVPASIDLII